MHYSVQQDHVSTIPWITQLKPPCPTRWTLTVYILQPLVQPIRTMHEASIFTIKEVHLNGRDYSMPWGGLLQLWVIVPCFGIATFCSNKADVLYTVRKDTIVQRQEMLLLSLRHTCVNKNRHYFRAAPQGCHNCIRRYHWWACSSIPRRHKLPLCFDDGAP